MKTISRYIMTLVLLITAVTGAWAQSYEAKVFDVPASWTEDETYLSAADLPKDFVQITKDEAKALAVPDGDVVLIYGFVGENVLMMAFENGTAMPDDDDDGAPEARGNFIMFQTMAKVCYTTPAGPKVAWDAATKTGTFSMPGSDVVLTPIYAKAAAFATTGSEPEAKTLLPEAAEGVIAGTDASLIADGTGIVAFAGTSTEVTQGTLMYAIGTSATEAPALTDFSATVPTAKTVADDGATLYVWYYIKGADAPDGDAATLDNTFDDTEPACLTVTVLSNKFDLTFNAANANTIEAGKATVTVDGTAATVTDGKLEGVKMGTEVKVKANTGYKFRKVEVKKVAPVTAITLNKTETSIKVGSTETLSVTAVAPDNATDKTYTWKTSDASKATVDQDGKVTAVAEGTVTIYAEANDGSGVKGNCTVTVTPAPALSLTSPAVGQVIGDNGKNYAAASVPSGVTKVAMIAYVNGSNGLAIALADEGEMNWYNAVNTAAAHTPALTGGTWKLPSENEWNQMKSAFNNQISGLSTAIGNAGGNGLGGTYWTSTEINSGAAKKFKCSEDRFINTSKGSGFKVRACLAF